LTLLVTVHVRRLPVTTLRLRLVSALALLPSLTAAALRSLPLRTIEGLVLGRIGLGVLVCPPASLHDLLAAQRLLRAGDRLVRPVWPPAMRWIRLSATSGGSGVGLRALTAGLLLAARRLVLASSLPLVVAAISRLGLPRLVPPVPVARLLIALPLGRLLAAALGFNTFLRPSIGRPATAPPPVAALGAWLCLALICPVLVARCRVALWFLFVQRVGLLLCGHRRWDDARSVPVGCCAPVSRPCRPPIVNFCAPCADSPKEFARPLEQPAGLPGRVLHVRALRGSCGAHIPE